MTTATPRLPRSNRRLPGQQPATDDVYYKQAPRVTSGQPPQAYVPYAPAQPVQSFPRQPQFAAADNNMMTLALVGLLVTTVMGIPIGLFTGISALGRARRVEELVNNGRRPEIDRSTITSVRIMSWVSIAWSVPLLLGWIAVVGLIFLSLAL
jgi:hypothetical protein